MAKGGNPDQIAKSNRSNCATSSDQPKTLSEMGVTKDQSSKWQKLADVPEEKFEDVIANVGMRVSATQVLATNEPVNGTKKIDVAALDFWGELCRMERDKYFDRPLSELVDEMTDGMQPDAIRIIPKLKRWLAEYDKS